jgi:exopolyphosphatase/guanosine-5'-triphosphate,3'-diphosphate pyrophosphatase
VIGSGGNINKLTKLFGRPNEHITIRNNLKYGYEQMKTMSVEERMEVFNLRADRADVIVPAAKIFLTIMDKIQSDLVLAPRIGVADGLIYQLYEKLNTKNHAS